jgi:hypothetical protein
MRPSRLYFQLLNAGETEMTNNDPIRRYFRHFGRRFLSLLLPMLLGAMAAAGNAKIGNWADEFKLQEKLQEKLGSSWATTPLPFPQFGWIDLTAAATITLLGFLLYMFRCRHARVYGQLEIAVGIFIAFQVIELSIGTLSYNMGGIFTALGALYIIVRGCDNVYKTLKSGEDATFVWNYLFFGKKVGEKLS